MTGMRSSRGLSHLLRKFWRSRDGNLTVTLALVAIPLIGAIGMAVDLSKANDVKARLQKSLDAAVLAGVAQVSAQQVDRKSVV